MPPPTPADTRRELRRRLAELQRAVAQAVRELSQAGTGEPLPGQYLVLEVGPYQGLVSSLGVQELVRLVECQALAGAPPGVLGSFLFRGGQATAIDLGHRLGLARLLSLDAHMLVLASTPVVALVVDRVRSAVEGPVVVDGDPGRSAAAWEGAGLLAGLCRVGDAVVPLLNTDHLVREVEGLIG